MARSLRIEYPGAIYHVMARGNERCAIFRSDADRGRFLKKLADLGEAHGVEVYAFVLMTNHYHLVVCTPRGNLTSFMQQFQTSYTMYFNRRYDRTGHLFAGRYKAPLVEGGHYLLRLTRYVHLNPIKTQDRSELGLERRRDFLHEYRWSSLPGYAGLRNLDHWVVYRALDAFTDSGSVEEARLRYLRFVEEGLARDDEEFLAMLSKSSKACGSDAFCREIEYRHRALTAGMDQYIDISRRRPEIPVPVETVTEAVLSAYRLSEAELLRRGNREAKDFWMRLLNRECALEQREIGKMMGHSDGATVSRRLKRLSVTLKTDPEAAGRYHALQSRIANRKA